MKNIKPIIPAIWLLLGTLVAAMPVPAQETTDAATNSESMSAETAGTNVPAPAMTNQAAASDDATDGTGNGESEGNPRHPAQPIVLFGQNAELKAGDTAEAVVIIGGHATIHGHVNDAVVVIGGELDVDGDVGDAVVAIFGDVHVNSGAKIRHDAVAVLGSVSAASGTKIGGDTVAIGGKLDIADGASVGGQKVNVGLPGPLGHLDWLGKWIKYCVLEFRPLAPQVGFVWAIAAVFFLIYLFIAAVFPHPVQVCVDDLNRRPATIFLMGLLTKLLVPFVYLILAITGVGLIVAPIIWVALLLCAIIGKVAIIEWLGARIGNHFGSGFQKPLAAFLIGTVIITLLYVIPVVGFLTYLLLSVWGLGSGVTAAFARLRRETPEPPAPPAPPAPSAPSAPTMPTAAFAPPVIDPNHPPTPGAGANLEPAIAPGTVPPIAPQPQPFTAPSPVPSAATSFPKAGLWEHICAAFLDIILIGLVSAIAGAGPYFLLFALAYFAGMWTWKGTTIGGIVLKLKVVRTDGRPLTFIVALVRGLAAAFSVAIFFLGFLWIAWDKDKQGWHDKIAGTEVIRLPHSAPLVMV